MSDKPNRPIPRPNFWNNPGYGLYRIWAELYTRWQENFNPKWREALPPILCQFCGQADHKEAYCPNLVKMGFIQAPEAVEKPDGGSAQRNSSEAPVFQNNVTTSSASC